MKTNTLLFKALAIAVAITFLITTIGQEAVHALQPNIQMARPGFSDPFVVQYGLAKGDKLLSLLAEEGSLAFSTVEDLLDREAFLKKDILDLEFTVNKAEILIEIADGVVMRIFDPERCEEEPKDTRPIDELRPIRKINDNLHVQYLLKENVFRAMRLAKMVHEAGKKRDSHGESVFERISGDMDIFIEDLEEREIQVETISSVAAYIDDNINYLAGIVSFSPEEITFELIEKFLIDTEGLPADWNNDEIYRKYSQRVRDLILEMVTLAQKIRKESPALEQELMTEELLDADLRERTREAFEDTLRLRREHQRLARQADLWLNEPDITAEEVYLKLLSSESNEEFFKRGMLSYSSFKRTPEFEAFLNSEYLPMRLAGDIINKYSQEQLKKFSEEVMFETIVEEELGRIFLTEDWWSLPEYGKHIRRTRELIREVSRSLERYVRDDFVDATGDADKDVGPGANEKIEEKAESFRQKVKELFSPKNIKSNWRKIGTAVVLIGGIVIIGLTLAVELESPALVLLRDVTIAVLISGVFANVAEQSFKKNLFILSKDIKQIDFKQTIKMAGLLVALVVLSSIWYSFIINRWVFPVDFVEGLTGAEKIYKTFSSIVMDLGAWSMFSFAFSIFYFNTAGVLAEKIRSFISGRASEANIKDSLKKSAHELNDKWIHMAAKAWMLWSILHFINYRFIPPHLTILYIDICNFGWFIFINAMLNKQADDTEDLRKYNKPSTMLMYGALVASAAVTLNLLGKLTPLTIAILGGGVLLTAIAYAVLPKIVSVLDNSGRKGSVDAAGDVDKDQESEEANEQTELMEADIEELLNARPSAYRDNHTDRVRGIAILLAQKMGIFDEEMLDKIEYAALLHDIGGRPHPVTEEKKAWLAKSLASKGIDITSAKGYGMEEFYVLKGELETNPEVTDEEREIALHEIQAANSIYVIEESGIYFGPASADVALAILFHHNIDSLHSYLVAHGATDETKEQVELLTSILVAADVIENGINSFRKQFYYGRDDIETPLETLGWLQKSNIPDERVIDAFKELFDLEKNVYTDEVMAIIADDGALLHLDEVKYLEGAAREKEEALKDLDELIKKEEDYTPPLFEGGKLRAQRPVIIGHRIGSIDEAKEALISGARMIEVDVQMTKDNVLVAHWGKVATEPAEKYVYELTYKELSKELGREPLKIRDLFDAVYGSLAIDLDVKDWSEEVDPNYGEKVLISLAFMIDRFDLGDDIYAATFNTGYMARLKQFAPDVTTGISLHNGTDPDEVLDEYIKKAKDIKAKGIAFYADQLSAAAIEKVHDEGLLVVVNAGRERIPEVLYDEIDMIFAEGDQLDEDEPRKAAPDEDDAADAAGDIDKDQGPASSTRIKERSLLMKVIAQLFQKLAFIVGLIAFMPGAARAQDNRLMPRYHAPTRRDRLVLNENRTRDTLRLLTHTANWVMHGQDELGPDLYNYMTTTSDIYARDEDERTGNMSYEDGTYSVINKGLIDPLSDLVNDNPSFRISKYLFWDIPWADAAITTWHERGHQVRAREAYGDQYLEMDEGYPFFSFYWGDEGYKPKLRGFGTKEWVTYRLLSLGAGLEVSSLTGDQIRRKILAGDARYNDSLLFIRSKFDLSAYIVDNVLSKEWQTAEDEGWQQIEADDTGGINDVYGHYFYSHQKYDGEPGYDKNDLLFLSMWNLADPYLYYAIHQNLQYIYTGEDELRMPSFMPYTRAFLTPEGVRADLGFSFRADLAAEDAEFDAFEVYLYAVKGGEGGIYGIGANLYGWQFTDSFRTDLALTAWRHPDEGLAGAIRIGPTLSIGKFDISASVGYKNEGYVPGELYEEGTSAQIKLEVGRGRERPRRVRRNHFISTEGSFGIAALLGAAISGLAMAPKDAAFSFAAGIDGFSLAIIAMSFIAGISILAVAWEPVVHAVKALGKWLAARFRGDDTLDEKAEEVPEKGGIIKEAEEPSIILKHNRPLAKATDAEIKLIREKLKRPDRIETIEAMNMLADITPEDREKVIEDLPEEIKQIIRINILMDGFYPAEKAADSDVDDEEILDKLFDIGKEHYIMAHGVEANKGGIWSLLKIILTKKIRGVLPGWGLLEGRANLPEINSGEHGPFWVVFDEPKDEEWMDAENHKYYLVPRRESKEYLLKAIDLAFESGVIGSEYCADAKGKVFTYEEFIDQMDSGESRLKNMHPADKASLYEGLPDDEKLSINDIMAYTARVSEEIAFRQKDKKAELVSATRLYLAKNTRFVGTIFSGENEPVVLRVPIELLENPEYDGIAEWLNNMVKTGMVMVELYTLQDPDADIAAADVYEQYGIAKSDITVEKTKLNTVSLYAASKDMSKKDIQESLILSESLRNSVIVPVGIKGDPTGIIRGAIFGMRLVHIARNPQDNEFIGETIDQYNKIVGSYNMNKKAVKREDLLALVEKAPGINALVRALKHVIETLPIEKISASEIRDIYERAMLVAQAA